MASVQQGGSAVELLVNADIEPDCDADGLGDETQDPSVSPGGDCPKAVRAIALEADRTKVKKGKSVTLSGRLSAPGSEVACAGSQGVELQRKKPSQTVFTTVAQLQTTATGNFSATMKLKKTFEFRAEVVETAACTAALSNDEKVKVKKKK